jgi:hypothetical protein
VICFREERETHGVCVNLRSGYQKARDFHSLSLTSMRLTRRIMRAYDMMRFVGLTRVHRSRVYLHGWFVILKPH